MAKPENTPALAIKTNDPRAAGYEKIVAFHRQLMEAKWRAQTAGQQLKLTPHDIVQVAIHAEESVAFLAEEILRLSVALEQVVQETSENVIQQN